MNDAFISLSVRKASFIALPAALQAGLLRRAWHTVAEGALRTGDRARARAMAETTIAADPLNEAACQRLRTTLATELGTDPGRATRDLHLAILRERQA